MVIIIDTIFHDLREEYGCVQYEKKSLFHFTYKEFCAALVKAIFYERRRMQTIRQTGQSQRLRRHKQNCGGGQNRWH